MATVESPMDSSFAALMIDLKQAQEATTQHDKYFLTLKDVGYKYLVGVHVPDRPVMLSNPVGPIEAAPPRVSVGVRVRHVGCIGFTFAG
jgi:hypothetical protein